MVRDAPLRRVSGRPEALRQPTRRQREKKLRSAFRAGRQIDAGLNGQATGGGRAARRSVVRGELLAALLCAESGPRNVVRLTLCGARITGRLDLSYARIEYPITLRDCLFDQPLVLAEARLGALNLDGSAFPGIEGTNLVVDGDLGLSRIRSSGPVTLADARVSGAVRLRKAAITVRGGSAPAFDGDGMTVGHDFNAAGLTAEGEVTLVDAHIAGVLDLGKSTLSRPGDVALRLDRAEVASSLYCNAGFTVTGRVDVIGAHVRGSVYFTRAELGKPPAAAPGGTGAGSGAGTGGGPGAAGPAARGAALRLVRTRIDGDLGCWKGFVAHRTIDIRRSSVGGEFSLLTTDLRGRPTAADLSHGRFATLTIAGGEPTGFLDFTKARCDFFRDGPSPGWPRGNIILDEFEYGAIQMTPAVLKNGKKPDYREQLNIRKQWLRRAMAASRRRSSGAHDGYLPQPYDQLAAAYRRVGDDHAARAIQLAKYRQRDRATSWRRWYSKVWNFVQDGAIGYGYVPWRALLWLGVLFVAGMLLFRYVGAFRPYSIVGAHRPGASFTLNNSVSYTLDLLLPTSGLQDRQAWQSSGPGEVAAAFLVALGLLLTATVFAAAARVLQRN
ncbi:MAG TPA: hypothetical protein VGM53_02980 [Streptosporangiaceae bacterium]|jgi:hypothetical protein